MPVELEQDADAYDREFVLDNRLMLHWYPERVMALAEGRSALELGLGHGFTTEAFSRRFQRYAVVDGSQEMIDRFRARFAHVDVDIRRAYFEHFSTEERFDNILMGFVLEHVDDPAKLLRHYARFIAPEGSVFIAVPNAESLHRRFGHAAGMLPDMQMLGAADLAFGHQRYFTLASLNRLVEDSGYVVTATEGILLKPITTQQMIDLRLPEEILKAMLKVGVDYPELCNALLLQIKLK
jgi:SAM-dependent methyltransferase